MTEPIGYLLAQSYELTGTSALAVDDDRGVATYNLAAGWYRTFLAPVAGAATEDDPAELLQAMETALDPAHWTLRMQSTGIIRVTYLGAGTGDLAIGNADLAALLGHTGGVISLASGSYLDCAYQPTHCVFAFACDPDTGWIDLPARFAGAALPTGKVYGWHDGRATLKRNAAFRALPKTHALKAGLGSLSTPAYPVSTRLLSPATGEPGQAPPWSAIDTHATAAGSSLGVCWGNFEAIVAGSSTEYDVAYLSPEHFTAGARLKLFVDGYDARRDWLFELLFAGAGAL